MVLPKKLALFLERHTTVETRFRPTASNLAQPTECRVYTRKVGGNELLFAVYSPRKIKVILTDGTVELIGRKLANWRDAIHYALGIIAAHGFEPI